MAYASVSDIGPLKPLVNRSADGKLFIYPMGVGGPLLAVTDDEWIELSSAVTDFRNGIQR